MNILGDVIRNGMIDPMGRGGGVFFKEIQRGFL